MYLARWKIKIFPVRSRAVAGVIAMRKPFAAPLRAAAQQVLGENDRAACDRRHTCRNLSQKHRFERNAVSTILGEDAGSNGRWTSSLRLLALTTGMILAMALGGVTATGRSLDGRSVSADASAKSILLTSASSSAFGTGAPPTIAYPPEWFSAPPQIASKPAARTLVVWHGAPRTPAEGPSRTRIAMLLLASSIAAGACLLFGRIPARRRR